MLIDLNHYNVAFFEQSMLTTTTYTLPILALDCPSFCFTCGYRAPIRSVVLSICVLQMLEAKPSQLLMMTPW